MDENTKYKILTTTVEHQFLIEVRGESTEINGWPIEEVIEDWFIRNNAVAHRHASRDGHEIGGGEKLVKWSFNEPKKPEVETLGEGMCDHCKQFTHEGKYVGTKWTCPNCR